MKIRMNLPIENLAIRSVHLFHGDGSLLTGTAFTPKIAASHIVIRAMFAMPWRCSVRLCALIYHTKFISNFSAIPFSSTTHRFLPKF